MLSDLLTRTVTIARRSPGSGTDEYGNRTVTTTTTTTVGELQQRLARLDAEANGHDDLSDTQWLLILPAGTGIDAGDRVIVDGRAYEVEGEPWPVRHPRTGDEHHVEVNLRRVAAPTDS